MGKRFLRTFLLVMILAISTTSPGGEGASASTTTGWRPMAADVHGDTSVFGHNYGEYWVQADYDAAYPWRLFWVEDWIFYYTPSQLSNLRTLQNLGAWPSIHFDEQIYLGEPHNTGGMQFVLSYSDIPGYISYGEDDSDPNPC